MTRAAVRVAAVALASALAACSSAPKVKPAELTTFTPSAEITVQWQAHVGAAGEFTFVPAVVGSTVYAADRSGTLLRLDDGKETWRIDVGQPLSGGVGANAKRVVVGTAKAEVLAFDAATGKPAWRGRVSSEVLAPPLVGDDIVAVRSGDSHITAFEAADGKRRWVYQRSTPALSLRSSVGVQLSEQVVLGGYPAGKLVAVSTRNGAPVWEVTVALPKGSTELERVADITSLPIIDGREICAAAFQGRVGCYDASTGNALWGRDLSSSAGIDLDRRHLYVTDDKSSVFAFDRDTGASVWKQDKLSLRNLTRPVALGRYVAVGDLQGYVHLLSREDGSFAARSATDGSAILADPQVLPHGLLVQTRNGGLFAFGVD